MNLRGLLASAAIFGALGFATTAGAAVLDWNFSFSLDNGDSASGIFVTQDTPSGGPYLITSLTGTISGNPMTLLSPDSSFNDNLLYTTQPYLDGIGLGFVAEGFQWAVFSSGGVVVDSWCNNANSGLDHQCNDATENPPDPGGSVTEFSVSPLVTPSVPEPSTWALMLLGFAGLGFAGYRKVRKSRAVSIA
jgi:hypothetical protein